MLIPYSDLETIGWLTARRWQEDFSSFLSLASVLRILKIISKLQLQLKYVRERSMLGDLKILVYTMRRILDKNFHPRELADVPKLELGAGAKVA